MSSYRVGVATSLIKVPWTALRQISTNFYMLLYGSYIDHDSMEMERFLYILFPVLSRPSFS
jgi:hypothetical protein